MTKLAALFLLSFTTTSVLSLEPVPFTINTKKWSHVLDDHFISITVNPTDLLQGKVYGLQMNSTMAILKGLAPAYVRIGSADTGKYTFKRNRYPSDVVKPDDEYTVTETHWMVFNEVARQAGLDVIVCLNAAHRSEGTKKWDTRNSLELISFSDSQGYNLTWQLGYEVQSGDDLSGLQFGKDLNRLRTILNAFPRYQHAKLIGPDIRVIHKKEDVDFWNDLLMEAGPTLDAVTWHPRWPQPSKMKVSENSELGYEFPTDYLEWDRAQLGKILQKSIFRNPVWIGETKRESTGTFAEGLIWARRLVLAAKLGIEVVMKQPNLMDVTHPKPEYWIALLHKRLLGRSVLETKSVGNGTELSVLAHCTNPFYWSDKPEKLQDGSVTVYAVNVGGLEQKIQMRGTWTGKSQLVFQYVLTSGSDPDSVFSQMTYLNGEPLMMTDDGLLPDIIPKIKKLERGLTMKLPPYSVGFFVVPEAKVKICQIQPQNMPTINIETLTPNAVKSQQKTLDNIRDINQFIVEKLKNPESESEEVPEVKIEVVSSESSETVLSKENNLPRVARRIRQVNPLDELNQHIKTIMQETQEFLGSPESGRFQAKGKLPKGSRTMEQRVQGLAEGISDAIKFTNQEQEFHKFLEDSGLNRDFGSLIVDDRRLGKNLQPFLHTRNPEGRLDDFEVKERLRRSISDSEEFSQEESIEDDEEVLRFGGRIRVRDDEEDKTDKPLTIPHQPDLKGLEEKYKQIVQTKLQDGKRKIDDIKRKIKQEEPVKTETVNDIQEEIIKKEIELLEKTEETVADILKSQKKRQETFEDIIFDELSDVKGERMRELEEMQRSQRKNAIVKRQVQTPLSKPLLKTVEYIEKNFNLEPESVRKIKRSLEERMGEILRNYDTKKSMEVKKRLAPLKEERKVLRKSPKEPERKPERPRGRDERREREREEEREEREEVRAPIKDRPKEKNVIKKTSSQLHHKGSRKPAEEMVKARKPTEEIVKARKPTEEMVKTRKPEKTYQEENDSFELFNRKTEEPVRKPERRRQSLEEGKKSSKKINKPPETKKEEEKEEEEEEEEMELEEKEEFPEQIPLKNDKERRQHMLQQISMMVDQINSKERSGSKRTKEDDDISEEFESDRRPRGIKRRPRKADMMEDTRPFSAVAEKIAEKKEGTPTADRRFPTKLSKPRKLRIRPNRKQKESKKVQIEDEEESQQRKRHLERPLLELEKKKLMKPKIRKLNPKFHTHGNELLNGDKPEILEIPMQQEKPFEQQEKPFEQLQKTFELEKTFEKPEKALVQQEKTEQQEEATAETPPSELNEEFKKDLEEIIEEKIFLGQGSETSSDRSETNGGESSKEEEREETATSVDGYLEPTEEAKPEEAATTGKPEISDDIAKERIPETENDVKIVQEPEVVSNLGVTKEEGSSGRREEEATTMIAEISEEVATEERILKMENVVKIPDDKPEVVDQKEDSSDDRSVEDVLTMTQIKSLEEEMEEKTSTEEKPLEIGKRIDEPVERVIPETTGIDSSQRKRRATFLTNRDEEDEEDYSSEERIQKFKQMVYRKSPTKKPAKNEVRPSSGVGMGADEFLRMAGSTVRVMFDDVIPEAYGQTKNKIQNMGITEYIKEFGNIVQQMKNLDQIFLNIGEAAVKGYIRGNRAEKGPYIQVISRKKRELKSEDLDLPEPEKVPKDATEGSSEHARTIAEEEIAPAGERRDREDDREVGTPGRERGKISHGDDSSKRLEIAEVRKDFRSGRRGDRETPRDVGTPGREPGKSLHEDDKTKSVETSETPKEKMETAEEKVVEPKDPKIKETKFSRSGLEAMLKDNAVSRKMTAYVPEDLQQKIFTPWIKTTKDFIQQALTTLQRQRELSEILANDLMGRDMTKKAIGKREAGEEEPKLPVYHMVAPSGNKKRETEQKHSDESLIRHLRGLQPGVYVVPTEEMTNIRSEQITNEAKQKSGLPNVVTLNIYYDKKNAEGAGKTDATAAEPKIIQDAVTYYHNKWNNPDQNQYLPDINPVVSPLNPALQTQTVFAAEPRVAELPGSRLIQYPSPTYHYPPVQKMYPGVVPNPHAAYAPVYYLPQEARYASQPPGTKRQWREFKARSASVPMNSGWNLQYDLPASIRGSPKAILPGSYNKNYKFLTQDKKRSVGDFKMDPTWSEAALPFWKFFTTGDKKQSESVEKEGGSVETDSSEDVFAENRKRAKAAVEKKVKTNSIEQVTEEKIPEEEEVVEEEKTRKRRSVDAPAAPRRLAKRSPYEFRDHDILPEWFGTYREIENGLDGFPPHVRRSHIISTPWSEEDEELLNILEADDELSLVDLDNDDYYYSNDNNIQHLRRYPRSTDQFESNMIKSNMIYKMPMDGEHLKPKVLGMTGIKKLADEDSSLELVTKAKQPETKPTESSKETPQQLTTTTTGPRPTETVSVTSSPPSANGTQPPQNGTSLLPRNPHDDTLYYFFKYAYDSLVKVMKSMTEFF